ILRSHYRGTEIGGVQPGDHPAAGQRRPDRSGQTSHLHRQPRFGVPVLHIADRKPDDDLGRLVWQPVGVQRAFQQCGHHSVGDPRRSRNRGRRGDGPAFHASSTTRAEPMSDHNIARASMWMTLGTAFSRATGLLRLLMLFWAIGGVLNADIFNNANNIPNAMYILVAGGIFNFVRVPRLVRTMKFDTDGGQAYANRVITLGLTVLFVATVILIAIVPWLLHVVFAQSFFAPELEAQRSAAILLMQLCMP